MAATRRLYLMRHAHAVPTSFLGDKNRSLDELGRRQVATVAARLASAGIERVLVSPAARTRQTAAGLGLGVETEAVDDLYHDGSDAALRLIRLIDPAIQVALVVGHNPTIAALVHRLADPARSDPEAWSLVASHFPTATCCRLDFAGDWSELDQASLRETIRSRAPGGRP
ncbi:MAG: histidine phosphatase family protein [Propionibacteriaceae bacterium]|jgi:phosphohistidine phosphatase|nr:histidine phosphatase family protein [Propionibacteriaceae bacterium]